MKFLATLIIFLSFNALAVRPAPERDHTLRLSNKNLRPLNFEGIIKLSNCSGSLVILKGASQDSKAIAMTNAHCLPFAKHDQVYVNYPYQRSFSVFDGQGKLHPLNSHRVLYATMIETDLALLETDKTYAEIERAFNLRPLVIDDILAPVGTPIDVVSGYWETVTSCQAEEIIPILKEHHWTWHNSIRYSVGCMTKGGFSGSPVIIQNTRIVTGIHNTGNNGRRDCSEMNPCEWGNQDHMPLKRRYAQQVHKVYNCLDQAMQLDLSISACKLPKPTKGK
jgi:hypothetical protein